jgi:hemerythrin
MNSEQNSDGIFVAWDERYAIGIPLIDAQHQELIRMTNELYKACLEEGDAGARLFKATIKAAVDYVKFHFSAEEKLLENVDYPQIAVHKKQHEEFAIKILEEVTNFEEGKKFVPNAFVRFLRDWILSHIALMDKKYAEYILNLKRQGKLCETLEKQVENRGGTAVSSGVRDEAPPFTPHTPLNPLTTLQPELS